MHYYGDDWFEKNGKDLDAAIRLFSSINRTLRGPFFLSKEKYGTMRLEYLFGNTRLDCHLFRLNCLMVRHKKLYRVASFLDDILDKVYVTRIIWVYQRFIFNKATLVVLMKYPHLQEELLDEPDFEGLLYGWVKKKINYVSGWSKVE